MNIYKLSFSAFLLFFFGSNLFRDSPQKAISECNVQTQNDKKSGATNIIFQSTDNGQTWQDISHGLPEDLLDYDFFVNENGLHIPAENGMYHYKPNSKMPIWIREYFPIDLGNTRAAGKSRMLVKDGKITQKIDGTNTWLPVFTDLEGIYLRSIVETSSGSILIGSDNGLLKSSDNGNSWKNVHNNGWVINIVESAGVILATNEKGILRSTDDGENWTVVLSEGGVGIAVESITDGFAAITYNTESKTRRVRTSYDGGKTWQPIDAELPPSSLISSIIQVGKYFFCGHPDGIFRSADKGKKWERILPPVGQKVFNLSAFGNVIYAIPRNGGC